MKHNLLGKKIGRWTIIDGPEEKNGIKIWKCRCECGTERFVRGNHLTSGASKSCGCHRYDHLKNRDRNYPIDVRNKRLETAWRNMHRRCEDKNNAGYKHYGMRGIKICEEWNDYVAFARWALQNGYNDTLTIDRIDNNKNYEPDNCRWVTKQEQTTNKRNRITVTIDGTERFVSDLSKNCDVKYETIIRRLKKGMDIHEALARKPHSSNGKCIPIRCIDTGECFSCISDAAQKYKLNSSYLSNAIRSGKMAYGKHWVFADD